MAVYCCLPTSYQIKLTWPDDLCQWRRWTELPEPDLSSDWCSCNLILMRHVSFGARMMARYPKITQYCRLCSGKIAARLWCFLPLCQFLRTGSCSLSRFIYRSDLPLEDVKHVTPPLKRFLFSSKQVLQARTETKHAVERSAGCRCTQAVRVVVWGHLCVLWCVETRSFPPSSPARCCCCCCCCFTALLPQTV